MFDERVIVTALMLIIFLLQHVSKWCIPLIPQQLASAYNF